MLALNPLRVCLLPLALRIVFLEKSKTDSCRLLCRSPHLFACSACGRSFGKNTRLTRHMCSDSAISVDLLPMQQVFSCRHCVYSGNAKGIIPHMVRCHPKHDCSIRPVLPGPKKPVFKPSPSMCGVCVKVLGSYSALWLHNKKTHG